MRERRWLRGARKGSPARQHQLGTFLRAAADQRRRGTPGRAVEKPQRGSCGGTEVTSARGKRAARPGPLSSAQLSSAPRRCRRNRWRRRAQTAQRQPGHPRQVARKVSCCACPRMRSGAGGGTRLARRGRAPCVAWDLTAAGVGDGSWTACLASGLRGL